ncbi:MAG: DUF6475 domain-containing protein [Burkholderiales bacterium]
MRPNEAAQFTRFLTQALSYWKADVSEFTLTVWMNACEPYTLEQVKKAMTAHATDAERGMFAPKVADIVRVLSGTHTDRALLAWGKTLEAMSSVGAYTDVVFDDPAIHATIEDLGGWTKICRLETKELSYLQHRFCESHKAYTGRGVFEYQRCLRGDRSPDHEYEKKGLPLPKPALVGDVQQALLVYRGGNLAGKTAITFGAATAALKLLERA